MQIKCSYYAIPFIPRPTSLLSMMSVRAETPAVALTADMLFCPDCGELHMNRLHVMTVNKDASPLTEQEKMSLREFGEWSE